MSSEIASSQPTPLVEVAVEQLRQDLVTGVHRPGEKLKVDGLRARYGYSSSPLREALNRLTQEGLVVADQRRGFRVAPISIEDFADITRLRLMMDLEALRESIEVGGDEWEVRSVTSFYRLQKVESKMSDGPPVLDAAWSSLHKDFHMSLLSGTRSTRLKVVCSNLFDQAERYRRVSATYRDEPRSKTEEHQAILDATMRRDVSAATSLLSAHISQTQERVARALSADDGLVSDAS